MNKLIAERLLKTALNDSNATFREGQWQAIDTIVNHRKKLLVVQRTGWGKSAVYFISSKLFRDQGKGLTIIISPLLALMRNQIEAATRLGLNAVTINSTNKEEWDNIKEQIRQNNVDCLLISPERLANEQFIDEVLRPIANQIALMVIDEAHCISDWGHDFRPDYRRIVRILRQLPNNMPVLCTTATANDRVVADIQAQIGNIELQRGSLIRESLYLQTVRLPKAEERLAWLAYIIPKFKGSGIIYTQTTRDAEKVAEWLRLQGIQAQAYYGSVTHPNFLDNNGNPDNSVYRCYLESQLQNNQLKVLVATSALGMGYDKPDISFVFHYQVPNSIISYYQQVGRAGRGIQHAFGLLMAGEEDKDIQDYFRNNAFPSEFEIESVINALEKSDGLSESDLQNYVNLSKGTIQKTLKFLNLEDPAPIQKIKNKWVRLPIIYKVNREHIQQITAQRIKEWQEIQNYIDYQGCKMNFLRNVLDDHSLSSCGKCDSCRGKPIKDIILIDSLIQQAQLFLNHSEYDIPLRKKLPRSNIFKYYNLPYKLDGLIADGAKVLAHYAENRLGKLVQEGKKQGFFSNELVNAVVEMLEQRWQITPKPRWITCVPSLRHPNLVPDFTQRLAQRLKIPFLPIIHKIKETEPQKTQENSLHQCHNLDGVFEVKDVPKSSGFLVDDIIDSRWTLTILTALLKQAGATNVFWIALADSSVKNNE